MAINTTTNKTTTNKTTVGGATMHADEMSTLVATKVAEMEAKLESMLKDPKLANTTKRTQKQQRSTMIHIYKLFQTVLEQCSSDEFDFSEEEAEWFKSMTTLSEERDACLVKVQKGDTLMGLIAKYPDAKDIVNKIKKACEKAGLTLNMATGIVE